MPLKGAVLFKDFLLAENQRVPVGFRLLEMPLMQCNGINRLLLEHWGCWRSSLPALKARKNRVLINILLACVRVGR